MALAPLFGIAAVWARESSGPPTPYVRPEFELQIERMRPFIMAAAHRHNRPAISRMTDEQFAATIAQILYNEHFGWLEDGVPILRPLTPLYQDVQIMLDHSLGANLSVWPSNLRPSVAEEILLGQLPVRRPDQARPLLIAVPVEVAGHEIDMRSYHTTQARYQAISDEISHPAMAVEYLAANLERGLYRAQYEHVPVTWETLAAWHNQGIVSPSDMRQNPTASDYIRRAAVYRALAEQLVAQQPSVPASQMR
jgi:hypothetical protein